MAITIETDLLISVVTLIGTVLATVGTFLLRTERRFNKITTLVDNKCNALATRLTVLETKMDIFWKGVEEFVPKSLMSPTHPEKDALLDKFPKLSIEEAITLKYILKEEVLQPSKKHLAFAYALIIARLDIIIYEKNMVNDKCSIQST